MSYKKRTYVCIDCGAEVTRARHPGDLMVCVDCGTARAAEAARQMAAKSGPYYDAWLASAGNVAPKTG